MVRVRRKSCGVGFRSNSKPLSRSNNRLSENDGRMALFKLTDRERGYLFLEEIDLEAQLAAVRSLLRRNEAADTALSIEIKDLENQAREAEEEYAWLVQDMWVERLEMSVYLDAAHSMAAVGMLAPMFEAMFTTLFRTLGASGSSLPKKTDRAKRADADYWNPQILFGSKGRSDNLIGGILQLAEDTGLKTLLPKDFGKVLTALFAYRNMMFHNGFEWPTDRRKSFADTLESQGVPEAWFSTSTRNKEVWIYYMSPAFVERCLALVSEVLTAIGVLTTPRPNAGNAVKGATKVTAKITKVSSVKKPPTPAKTK
jgi:hypothetical protein